MAQVRIEVEGHLSHGLGSGELRERWEREMPEIPDLPDPEIPEPPEWH